MPARSECLKKRGDTSSRFTAVEDEHPADGHAPWSRARRWRRDFPPPVADRHNTPPPGRATRPPGRLLGTRIARGSSFHERPSQAL